MSEICGLTIKETARLFKAGDLSPVELIEAVLRRIESLDAQVNAFLTVTGDLARAQARKAEREIHAGHHRGPLHGIPIGLKDIYCTAGIRTTGHSKVFEHYIPAEDAAAVAKLYGAGAILVGKLATHELAHGGPSFDLPWPPARNPWNTDHFTGGSSSGSAAAVAAQFVMGALGSDTGGSIRTPASLCGIVGLKPTYGLVSRRGVIPNSYSLDHCGPMARTAEDCAVLLQAIAGFDEKDPTSCNRSPLDYCAALTGDIRGLRIGVLRHFWEEDLPVHDELRAALENALDLLARLGAKVEVARIRPLQEYYDIWNLIEASEILSVHRANLIQRTGDFGSHFLGRTLAACVIQSGDYVDAQCARRRMVEEMASLYARYDILLTPGSGPAPRLGAGYNAWPRPNTFVPFNMTGGPALAICIGFSSTGLPLAMQLAGRPFDEPTLFRVAEAYEKATTWHTAHPLLVRGVTSTSIEDNGSPTPLSPETDGATLALCAALMRHMGLTPTDTQLMQVCRAASQFLRMIKRTQSLNRQSAEPANVFNALDYVRRSDSE